MGRVDPMFGQCRSISPSRIKRLGHPHDIPTSLSGTIEFDVHLGTGTQGQPAFSTSTPFHGPGTYPMPNGFVPTTPGIYYVQVMTVNTSDSSSYQVSPFGNPNLTTTIAG